MNYLEELPKVKDNSKISQILNYLDKFPVYNSRIYQNGSLLFEGKHLRITTDKEYILDETGQIIFIEGNNFTYVNIL